MILQNKWLGFEMKNRKADTHWLLEPATIRKIWIAFIIVLVMLVIADFFVYHKSYFGIDGTFGFGAWFSFLSCLILVVIAKVFGALLKRSETYYDR